MRTRSESSLPALLTVREAASMLRISETSAYRHAATGVLPVVRVGGLLRIRADALAKLLEDGRADVSSASSAPTGPGRPSSCAPATIR